MIEINILEFIPQELRQQAQDALVDFVSEQAKKFVSDGTAEKLKQLRTDGAFRKQFDKGLDKALKRFAEEYYEKDEDLVDAIVQEKDIFKSPDVKQALMTMLKSPGSYLADEGDVVAQTFDSVLPGRKNRERVNKAMIYLLRCLVEELWHLPELQPVYSLQFQKITAEAMKQQVELQKVQLQALVGVNEGVRQALLQLTDAIGEKKLLPSGNTMQEESKPNVLHNLPNPEYGDFIGRESEISQIHQILRPYPHSQHSLVCIDGIGGVGKSSLALEIAYYYLRNYKEMDKDDRFDAIIWISAKQNILTSDGIIQRARVLKSLDDIYTAIAITLQRDDINRAAPTEQPELVQSALTQQRTLLIIDNLETVDDESVISFLREIPAPTKAIVTTRHRIDVAYPIRLKQMYEPDALELIDQEYKKRNIVITSEDALSLYRETDGLPLAIVWSLAQVASGYTVRSVLNKLSRREGDINKYCFSAAFEKIKGSSSEKVIKTLGVLPKDASREQLGIFSEVDEISRDDALVQLEKLSLVNKQGDRFSLLQLTKNFILAFISTDEQKVFRLSALEYITNQFKTAQENNNEAYSRSLMMQERENVLGLIDWALTTGHQEKALKAIDLIHETFWQQGFWSILSIYLKEGISASNAIKDVFYAGLFEKSLGRMLRIQGNFPDAKVYLEKALSHFISIEDQNQIIDTQRSLSMFYAHIGDLESAERLMADCLLRVETSIDVANKDSITAHLLNNYTEILLRNKDFEKADKCLLESERLAQKSSTRDQLALNSRLRGKLYFEQGQYENATQSFFRCLDLCEAHHIVPDQGYAMKWLARISLKNKRLDDARMWAEKAKDKFEFLGMKTDILQIQDVLDQIKKETIN